MESKYRPGSSSAWTIPLFVVLLVAIAGVTWANYRFAQQNPGGNDFLVHWIGTRALLIDGLSPYSDEVATRIQAVAYGRPALPGEHELRVAYPLYAGIIFAPFAMLGDYVLARALWMTTLEVAVVVLSLICLRLVSFRPAIWLLTAYLVFSIFWYHAVRPIINGNAVIIVAVLVAGSLVALKVGRDELTGIILGFSTIKPQVVVILLIFIFLWCATQRRWKPLIWFCITVVLLTAIAMYLIPDWLLQNIREVIRYPQYNPPTTIGSVFSSWWHATGEKLSWVFSAFLCLTLLVEWLNARRKDFRWFLWAACLTLVIGQWLFIATDPGNFVILFIPLVLIFAVLAERFGWRAQWFILMVLVLVGIGLWVAFVKTIEPGYQPQQSPIMFFLLPLLLLIGLFWVRWWAIKPSRLLIDLLREYDEK